MKLLITLDIDENEDHCEAVLEEIETSILDGEIITVRTGAGHFDAAILAVKEQPASGRERKHPDQLTIDDLIGDDS